MPRIKYQEVLGLEVKRGRPPVGPAPSKEDLVRLYVREGMSVRDVAAALGCSKDAVHRGLRTYRIKTRTSARRSKLRDIDVAVLETGIKENGVRGYARELGVHENTLRNFLKMSKR